MNWRKIQLDIIVGIEERKRKEEETTAQVPLYMHPPEPPRTEEVTGSNEEKPERGIAIIDYSID